MVLQSLPTPLRPPEAEPIGILHEAAAKLRQPILLCSIGKASMERNRREGRL